MELDAIRTLLEIGSQGLFLWLYLRLDDRLQKQDERHEAELRALHQQRVNDLKFIAKLPTDLVGSQPAHAMAG